MAWRRPLKRFAHLSTPARKITDEAEQTANCSNNKMKERMDLGISPHPDASEVAYLLTRICALFVQ